MYASPSTFPPKPPHAPPTLTHSQPSYQHFKPPENVFEHPTIPPSLRFPSFGTPAHPVKTQLPTSVTRNALPPPSPSSRAIYPGPRHSARLTVVLCRCLQCAYSGAYRASPPLSVLSAEIVAPAHPPPGDTVRPTTGSRRCSHQAFRLSQGVPERRPAPDLSISSSRRVRPSADAISRGRCENVQCNCW